MAEGQLIKVGVALLALSMLGFGGWVRNLPAATMAADAPPVPQAEADAMLVALAPDTGARPLIAIVPGRLNEPSAKGASIIGIGIGAKVVAAAGLLDGRQATTHWYYCEELPERHPAITHVANRPMAADARVVSTTGVTASMALTLTEAIAGRDQAETVAGNLGVRRWGARHDSDAFRFSRGFALTALGNRLALWNWDRPGIKLTPGMDKVSLALVADAWARTYRSGAVTFAVSTGAVTTPGGIRVLPDEIAARGPARELVPAVGDRPPAQALEQTLGGIETRYGTRSADFVARPFEYARLGQASAGQSDVGTSWQMSSSRRW